MAGLCGSIVCGGVADRASDQRPGGAVVVSPSVLSRRMIERGGAAVQPVVAWPRHDNEPCTCPTVLSFGGRGGRHALAFAEGVLRRQRAECPATRRLVVSGVLQVVGASPSGIGKLLWLLCGATMVTGDPGWAAQWPHRGDLYAFRSTRWWRR